MTMRFLLLLLVAGALSACGTTKDLHSVAGGECRVFEAPKYVVLGKTDYDQDYIDGGIEAGVAGCQWQRPAARPASLDAGRATAISKPVVKKKRGFFRRIKDRVVKPKQVDSWPTSTSPLLTAPIPAVPAAATAAPIAPPAPPPRDPVDELLDFTPKNDARRVR
jgi:hypothetical protein